MIPQGYPLWLATSRSKVGRVVAWMTLDDRAGLYPIVAYNQSPDGANPVVEAGWYGDTADEALKAATPLEPPPPLPDPWAPQPVTPKPNPIYDAYIERLAGEDQGRPK